MYQASELELNKLLSIVLERNASDLHLITGEPPIIRVDGVLTKLDGYEVLNNETVSSMADLMLSPEQREVFKKQMDVDVAYSFKDNNRFRVNVYRQKGQVAAAFRHIPNRIKTIEELNLPQGLLAFTQHKQGLVLVVGPTGHGKSTTLASLIDNINHSRADHILTIEDPVEFVFTPDRSIINQREVYIDTPSFAEALRASLREDCNVILVGEMRDYESISTVLTLAETGHLVFATLHTNDAGQSIDRIVDVFPANQQSQVKTQLANVLHGIVSLRLLPKVGGGRVPACEILTSTNAVRNVIREGKTFELDNIVHTSGEEGMIALDKSLGNLVAQGLVSVEDALPNVKDVDYFKSIAAAQ
ncbi:PilT/PilU family type 4a pilus ATPase [Patescibacteria group bacterium]|nr:PilT/PilU family type 4a pilus ATPase [Patescibacteria group bacterium]